MCKPKPNAARRGAPLRAPGGPAALLGIIALLFSALPALARETAPPRVIVFVFERASWFQLMRAETPNLDDVLCRGAVGLMNPPREPGWEPELTPARRARVELVRDGARERLSAKWNWPPAGRVTRYVWEDLRFSDWQLGRATEQVDPSRDLLIVVAVPGGIELSHVSAVWGAMSPVAVVGPGFDSGVLTSTGTRRAGIVSNTDIAPTILRFLGTDVPDAMSGRPLRVVPSGDAMAAVARLDRATSAKFRLRPLLVFCQAVWGMMALAAGIVGLALGVRGGTRAGRLIGAALLLSLALPIGLLLQPLAPLEQPWAAAIVAFGWAAFALWAVMRIGAAPVRLGVLCAAVAVGLLAATLTRSDLLWRSALGYDLIRGSRFYGIGNEWMAILVASAAVASGAAGDLWRRVWPWHLVLWLALILIIGAPALGANWGGCLTAAAAGIVLLLALARPVRWWHAIAAVCGAAAAVAAVLLAHVGASSQTHIARSVHLIARHGLAAAGDLVRHRFTAAVAPFDYTPLVALSPVLMLIALFTLIRPCGPWRSILAAWPGVRAGLIAAVVGGFAAAVLNDSGMVALATACAVALPSLLYVGLIQGSQDPRAGA